MFLQLIPFLGSSSVMLPVLSLDLRHTFWLKTTESWQREVWKNRPPLCIQNLWAFQFSASDESLNCQMHCGKRRVQFDKKQECKEWKWLYLQSVVLHWKGHHVRPTTCWQQIIHSRGMWALFISNVENKTSKNQFILICTNVLVRD